jgi:hypothetical protein
MRKTIIMTLVVVLLCSAFGGFVYAQSNSHDPMKGQKLLGVGTLGRHANIDGGEILSQAFSQITNPSCEDEITIERIALIRGDGTVIYEGPFLRLVRDENDNVIEEIPIIDPIQPHQFRGVTLWRFMKDPDSQDPNRWLTLQEALDLPVRYYTLEVMWSGGKQEMPLTGWVNIIRNFTHADGNRETSQFSNQMVNMK